MPDAVVNTVFLVLAFALAFGFVRTIVYIRAKHRIKLGRDAAMQHAVPVASGAKNKNKKKRRRLEQVAARQSRTAQRDSLKDAGRRSE